MYIRGSKQTSAQNSELKTSEDECTSYTWDSMQFNGLLGQYAV